MLDIQKVRKQMIKEAFINAVALRCGLHREQARKLVALMLEGIAEGLAVDGRCMLKGFGSLRVIQKRGGKRKNPASAPPVRPLSAAAGGFFYALYPPPHNTAIIHTYSYVI